MIDDKILIEQLNETIDQIEISESELKRLDLRYYSGKVRECFTKSDLRALITTDRLSVFDVIVSTVPFKGQVLTDMANFWFEKTSHIVKNHLVNRPHPNVVIAKECQMLPVEVVVRSYLVGTLYKDYLKGNNFYNLEALKSNRAKEYSKFEQLIITPTTKAPKGEHDEPITETEIVTRGIVEQKIWDEVRDVALSLFKEGEKIANQRGLILADTKYEFGFIDGKLVLADEIHTLDCARYWQKESYEKTLLTGEPPVMLDKQVAREWFLSQGYSGSGVPPVLPNEQRIALAKLYINSYEQITGKEFKTFDRLSK